MTAPERRLLPNAADKTALKAIATTIVQNCPSLLDAARQVAIELLTDKGLSSLDPDKVYFHRFKTAQSSTLTFTGWEHLLEKPCETLTLTQLVVHRFRATDQDNADLLGLYCGFYSDGPDAENFNQSNEVRLLGSDVLKAFWAVDFSTRYSGQLTKFWQTSSDDFRALAKCNFLSQAVQALQQGDVDGNDFQRIITSLIGPVTWPVTLQMLRSTYPIGAQVRTLDLDGHVATNVLRLVEDSGRQTLYLPGQAQAFRLMDTAADLHWWLLEQMNSEQKRPLFLKHFSLADSNHITENLTDLMNRLVSTWGHSDHRMINSSNVAISGDAFTWLSESTRTGMVAEAHLVLTSNSDLRKKLWTGYLSAGLKVFGPMAAVGWPAALPLIGAGVVNTGLNIDQAINGVTATERRAGVIGAVLSAIETVFNVPFLIGTGAQLEVGPQVEYAEAEELRGLIELTSADSRLLPPLDPPPVTSSNETASELANEIPGETAFVDATEPLITPALRQGSTFAQVPASYRCNELLAQHSVEATPGKYEGIYRLDKEPGHAIEMDGAAYYVRYFADSHDSGNWAIINPERPNQFAYSLPVRLGSAGKWERIPALRLRGGGQCVGKACLPESDVSSSEATPSVDLPRVEPLPGVPCPLRPVTKLKGISETEMPEMRRWAMNLPNPSAETTSAGRRYLLATDRYVAHFGEQRTALLNKAEAFYRELKWINLPQRPVIPPVSPQMEIDELIDLIFANTDGLAVGETLDRIASTRFMIENMPKFARHIKTLYVRGLLSDFAQDDLNHFYLSGDMSEDLSTYLSSLGTDPENRFNMLELIRAAQANGVRVHGLDAAETCTLKVPLTSIEEQMIQARLSMQIMERDKLLNRPGKWVALVDATNTNTFRDLAGISELRGGIGLRIEEVWPDEVADLRIDPGVEVARGPFYNGATTSNAFDPLFADLRLQVKAPVPPWNDATLEKLLHRNGMFVIRKTEPGTYTLVRRNSASNIVQTRVHCTADGRFYIWDQSMRRITGMVFRDIAAVAERLIELGMTLQSRLPA